MFNSEYNESVLCLYDQEMIWLIMDAKYWQKLLTV
jgi:hypothetical protein